MSMYNGSAGRGGGGGQDPDHDLSFRDADDYVERRRQKEILDAVQFVREVQNTTESEFERGEIDLQTRQAEVRTAVNSLIVETEQLVAKSGSGGLLEEKPLAAITLQPPGELVQFVQDSESRIWGDSSLKPKRVYEVHGLLGYLNSPPSFSATWQVRADVPDHGPQRINGSSSTRMPVDVSMDVYRQIKKFLSDVDLDIGAQLEDYTGDEGPGL